MLDKEIHVHVHIDKDCCKYQEQLDRIESKLDQLLDTSNEPLKQEIMDKLNALNEDIKSTIP